MRVNDRLVEVVYLILQKKQVTLDELAEHFNISQRTVYRDIQALALNGVPVYTITGDKISVGITTNIEIDEELMQSEDKQKIFETLKGLNNFDDEKDIESLEMMSVLFNKKIHNWINVDYTGRNAGPNAKKKFKRLKSGILNQRLASFKYCSSDGEESLKVVQPLQIWYKSNKWYLYGFLPEEKEYKAFKMTRIKDVNLKNEHFQRVTQKYQSPIKSVPAIVVKLAISKELAERVYDEFDVEEITKRSDGNFIVNVMLPDNNSIYDYILSFGEYVKVLEPPEIQEALKIKAKKIFRNYM